MKKKILIIIATILMALTTVGGIIFYLFIPPKIQLNGNKTITIALEGKYQDEGIKVIWHNTSCLYLLYNNIYLINTNFMNFQCPEVFL